MVQTTKTSILVLINQNYLVASFSTRKTTQAPKCSHSVVTFSAHSLFLRSKVESVSLWGGFCWEGGASTWSVLSVSSWNPSLPAVRYGCDAAILLFHSIDNIEEIFPVPIFVSKLFEAIFHRLRNTKHNTEINTTHPPHCRFHNSLLYDYLPVISVGIHERE